MKKMLLLAVIAIFAVSCTSVPQVAKDAFAAANPTATDVKWEKDGDKFDVSYVIEGVRYDAEYDKAGNIIADDDCAGHNHAGHNHADKACAEKKSCEKADCTCGCKDGKDCTCAKSCEKADCTCGCKDGAACTCAKADCAKSCEKADSAKCDGKTVHADGKTCDQKHAEGACCKK